MDDHTQHRSPGLLDILKSVGAAFFGVQSEANRRRDFTHGKAHHYVIAGLVGTVAFVAALYGLVQLILHFVGPS